MSEIEVGRRVRVADAVHESEKRLAGLEGTVMCKASASLWAVVLDGYDYYVGGFGTEPWHLFWPEEIEAAQ